MVLPWKDLQRASYDPVECFRKPPRTLNISVQKAACDMYILVDFFLFSMRSRIKKEKNDFWHKKIWRVYKDLKNKW